MANALYLHRFDKLGARYYWLIDLLEAVYPFTWRDCQFLRWHPVTAYREDYWQRRN